MKEETVLHNPPVLALSRHNGQRPEVLNAWAMDGGGVQRPGHCW